MIKYNAVKVIKEVGKVLQMEALKEETDFQSISTFWGNWGKIEVRRNVQNEQKNS